MAEVVPEASPAAPDSLLAPSPMPRLALSVASLCSSFNPYATADATATPNSQPDANVDEEASQDKSSQDKDTAEEAPKGTGKQPEADKDDEEVFKRPLPVFRSNAASKQADKAHSQDESSSGNSATGGDEDSNEWFSDLARPAAGAPGTEVGDLLGEKLEQAKLRKKQKQKEKQQEEESESIDDQAHQIAALGLEQRRKAARLIRETYRRPSNMPPLPPPEIIAEEVISDIRQRVKPLVDEKKMLLQIVGRGEPMPFPLPSQPGLSADSVDDVASASAAGEEPSGKSHEEGEELEVELIIAPPPRQRPSVTPLVPPPTTQELEAETEQQLAASATCVGQSNTPGLALHLRMPTLASQSQSHDDIPLSKTTVLPMSSLSSSQVSQVSSQPTQLQSQIIPLDASGKELSSNEGNEEDDDEIAAVLAAAGLAPPESAAPKKKKAENTPKPKEDISSVADFSDDGESKKNKKSKSGRKKTAEEEVLGDSDEGAPSSEEEGEELVSEERSEELSDEDLRAVVNSSDEEELDPADPQTLYKRLEDEEFNAGIAAMHARLAAKKAQIELPTQRRKRKGGGDEAEEDAGEEDEVPATIPVPDDDIPAVASLETGAAAGSDGEETVPMPTKPPAPRDEAKRRRTALTSSSLLDEPDAKEVLASMRSAGSFRQAPQALRERKGTSFIADKAEKKGAATKGSKPASLSSSSSLSASASLSLSHSGYVFGRDSGSNVAKAKPTAATAAPSAATAKGASESKKRSQRPAAASAPLSKKGSALLNVLSQNFFEG